MKLCTVYTHTNITDAICWWKTWDVVESCSFQWHKTTLSGKNTHHYDKYYHQHIYSLIGSWQPFALWPCAHVFTWGSLGARVPGHALSWRFVQGVNVVKDLLTRWLLPFADGWPNIKTIQAVTLRKTETDTSQRIQSTGNEKSLWSQINVCQWKHKNWPRFLHYCCQNKYSYIYYKHRNKKIHISWCNRSYWVPGLVR